MAFSAGRVRKLACMVVELYWSGSWSVNGESGQCRFKETGRIGQGCVWGMNSASVELSQSAIQSPPAVRSACTQVGPATCSG